MQNGGLFFLVISLLTVISSPEVRAAEENPAVTENLERASRDGNRSQQPSFPIESWEKRLNERQPPVKIMDAIGASQGMVIGEVGAGTGRMTMWLAERVGPSGKIYANDIDEEHLEELRKRCERDGFDNIEIIVGEVEDPKLPTGALDLAFMINVYHHLDNPVPLIRNILPSLKPEGALAIVECDPDKVEWGEEEECNRKTDVVEELEEAGFEVVRIETFLNEDNIYIAKPIGEPRHDLEPVVNDGYGDYVLVPEGEFPMGDNFNEGAPRELPVHVVHLDAYYIGKYPVTNGEYKKFMDDGGYVNRKCWMAGGYGDFGLAPRYWNLDHDPFFKGQKGEELKVHGGGLGGTADFPVIGVNWYEASAYCSWLSFKTGQTHRLPTEAEWEKAARGTYEHNRENPELGHQRRYPWGDTIDGSYANFLGSGDEYDDGATPVGYYDGSAHGGFQTKDNASPYGAYDMIGNVWEWCSDWRSDSYYQECRDKGTVENPTGPNSGRYRIVRGSDWHHDALQKNSKLYHDPRCAWRNSELPSVTGSNFGFRCVREAK